MFELGQVVATPGAIEALLKDEGHVLDILARHLSGDWGNLDEYDKQANEAAVLNGSRILSAYDVAEQKVWIITEADRAYTTILLPEEY